MHLCARAALASAPRCVWPGPPSPLVVPVELSAAVMATIPVVHVVATDCAGHVKSREDPEDKDEHCCDAELLMSESLRIPA